MLSFSEEQSRRLDEIIGELASAAFLPTTSLVQEFADQTMREKFGRVWDEAEIHAAEARVRAMVEKAVAREVASRLADRLLNPHVTL
jgi:hypothetical protein